MKHGIIIHILVSILFLVLVGTVKDWLHLSYWLIWVGGALGLLLPDLDHLIYIFFIGPQELTSQRVIYLLRNRNLLGAVKLILETRAERKDLVLHSNLFLVVALILTFWILTSSSSVIGAGLVSGAMVHLLLDRVKTALYHGAQ
jgi:hypothetical protein